MNQEQQLPTDFWRGNETPIADFQLDRDRTRLCAGGAIRPSITEAEEHDLAWKLFQK